MTKFNLTFDDGKTISVEKPGSEKMLRQLYPVGSRFKFMDGSVSTVADIDFPATLATGRCRATTSAQQFLQSCEAVKEIREDGDDFVFDYDPSVDISFVPESLEIEW